MYEKIKEMQYGSRTSEVIARGQSDINNDVKFIVINCRGSHMCAYVTFPGIDGVDDYDCFYVDCDVHGGFTFLGKVGCANDDVKYIGWDYAHLGDFTCSGIPGIDIPHLASGEHKWTVDEVIKQAEAVADAIAAGKHEIDGDDEDEDDGYSLSVMVSLPCHGRTDEELDAVVEKLNNDNDAKEQIIQLFQDDSGDCYYVPSDVLFIRNKPSDNLLPDATSNKRLYYLGMAIGLMSAVDAVYFVDGWASAKGCLVEKLACDLYDIPYIIERKED